jgi:hypothetical protein
MDAVFTQLFDDIQKNEKANKVKSKKESDIFEKPNQTKKKPSKMNRFLKKKGMVKGTVVEQLQKKPEKDKDKPHLYVGKKMSFIKQIYYTCQQTMVINMH